MLGARRLAREVLRRLRQPGPARSTLALQRFLAPDGVTCIRLPLGALAAVPPETAITITLLAPGGTWRQAVIRGGALPDDAGWFAFTAIGRAGCLGLLIGTGPQPDGRARWMARRRLRRVSCIDVPSGAPAGVAIPPGPVHAMHMVVPVQPPPAAPQNELPVCAGLGRFWRAGGALYIEGWLHAYAETPAAAWFEPDQGGPVAIPAFQDRPDLRAHYPMLPAAARAGFAVRLPRHAGATVRLVVAAADGRTGAVDLGVPQAEPDGSFAWNDPAALLAQHDAAWQWFQGKANAGRLAVLEIGARVVAVGSSDERRLFSSAGSYVGMDVHPGPGVDVVGDVHRLSNLVGGAAFDALFSSAVLEHLAMPWLAAAEMNRALRPGGLVFHRTHQAWPLHERPNDFYRYSDEALAVLFGPAFGFETIKAGMAYPMAAYPRDMTQPHAVLVPLNPLYGMSWVLARKTAEIGPATSAAAVTADVVRLSCRYPPPA